VVVALPVESITPALASEASAVSTDARASVSVRVMPSVDGDLVRSYLRDIGRVPLLSHEQEITLGRQVQELMALEELELELEVRQGEKPGPDQLAEAAGLTPQLLRRRLQAGRRAKERMVAANLRLVVSVAKKYTRRNMELLDLIQEGTIGLVRGVEKFDPTRGYKFSTYAYWWIRQGITRAIAEKSRTIRLPIHITETLNKLKKGQRELSQELGRTPTVTELDGECLKGDLRALLDQLPELQGKVLKMRYGIEGEEPMSLTGIGRILGISRDRVRNLERDGLAGLRRLSDQVEAYVAV
jgi:RNA polymerase nonessential primary-like sigma factor